MATTKKTKKAPKLPPPPPEGPNPCANCGGEATRMLHGERFCESCYEHQTEEE